MVQKYVFKSLEYLMLFTLDIYNLQDVATGW